MFNNLLFGIAVLGCASYVSEMQPTDDFPNVRSFSNVNVVDIRSNGGDINIKPSSSYKTIVTFDGSPDAVDIFQHGGKLSVENKQKSYFSFFNTKVNFCIYTPSSVHSADINLGDGRVAVESPMRKLSVAGGNLDILIREMKGDIKISAGKCNVKYIGETRTLDEKSKFDISAGHVTFTAFLSDAFRSMCNWLRSPATRLRETFLPVRNDDADLIIEGSCGSADISVKKLSDM